VPTTSITTDKLDAPEAGPLAVGDHVSWPLRLDASYNDGRERAYGEIHFLGYEGNLPIAHIDVHDRLHRATGLMRAVPRKRLRREKSVSEPTTTAAEGAAVREAAAAMHPLAVVIRETTGHVVSPQTAHQQQQDARQMSSSEKWFAPRRSTSSSAGHPTPVREGAGMGLDDALTASVREGAGGLTPKEPLGTARAYGLFLGNLQSGRR